jgi:hypothetical protein
VDDGPRSEDLGINFRRLADTILARHLAPRMDAVAQIYDTLRGALRAKIEQELDMRWFAPGQSQSVTSTRGVIQRLFKHQSARARPEPRGEPLDASIVAAWDAQAHAATDASSRAAYRALARVSSGILVRHGRRWGNRETIAAVATDLACNDAGSAVIGETIEPWFDAAVRAEGLRRLPAQAEPFVLNTKGASASGKSTMRPLLRALAGALGVHWEEFALISPDIWRKFLLDYAALGQHYKYAGSFTAQELRIIDQKLDHYMARKAERGAMSHLMIDRFRFDSFAPESDEAGSNLLTRFGHSVYLFFMITPPEATVERAWLRGLAVGRYKAVEDLLAHNVEAYTGMPELFFTWAKSPDKRVHFEFLDNSVALAERPRSVAFGWNGEMNVLDVPRMLDIDRFRRIRVDARRAQDVYPAAEELAPANNTAFLARCVQSMAAVNFADRETGRVYARTEHGCLSWVDRDALPMALADPEARAGLRAVLPAIAQGPHDRSAPSHRVIAAAERRHTIGRWGRSLDGVA